MYAFSVSMTGWLLCMASRVGFKLSVTSLVEVYKVANVILQSILCESKDVVIPKNALEVSVVEEMLQEAEFRVL